MKAYIQTGSETSERQQQNATTYFQLFFRFNLFNLDNYRKNPQSRALTHCKGTPPKKKCFLSGIARMRGGRPLPELKNTLYIFLYDGRKRCTSCPKEGEGGGGRGNSGNARKKTFFFKGGVPLHKYAAHRCSFFLK